MSESITRIIEEVRSGQPNARDRLLKAVYDELRQLAAGKMRGERIDHTLQATALVNEAYLRIRDEIWENRAHFFFAAARAMRQILVDHARAKRAAKRGGDHERVPLDASEIRAAETDGLDVLELDAALDDLQGEHPRQADVVQLICFAGLGIKEIAEVLECSPSTVDKDWLAARRWLKKRLS